MSFSNKYIASVYEAVEKRNAGEAEFLQAVREELARDKGRVEQSVECDLDGHYRPVNIRKHYATADLRRPVMVWLHVV